MMVLIVIIGLHTDTKIDWDAYMSQVRLFFSLHMPDENKNCPI